MRVVCCAWLFLLFVVYVCLLLLYDVVCCRFVFVFFVWCLLFDGCRWLVVECCCLLFVVLSLLVVCCVLSCCVFVCSCWCVLFALNASRRLTLVVVDIRFCSLLFVVVR